MKKITLLITVLFSLTAMAQMPEMANDTIVTRITTVMEINNMTNDTIVKTMTKQEIREVAVQNESSYMIDEDNNVVSFFWQWKKKSKTLKPHWSGFGMSFINYDDKNIPHGSAKLGSSFNFTFNFMTVKKQIASSNFLFYTGLGTEWAKYKFDDNAALTKVDGITQFLPAAEGVNYVSSKLTAYYITVPAMFEYQTSGFHVSAGAIFMIKWHSKSQTRYYDDFGKHKDTQGKDLNILPVNMRLRAQVGYKDFSLHAFYSPISMFKGNKGPKLRTYGFGAMFHF